MASFIPTTINFGAETVFSEVLIRERLISNLIDAWKSSFKDGVSPYTEFLFWNHSKKTWTKVLINLHEITHLSTGERVEINDTEISEEQ